MENNENSSGNLPENGIALQPFGAMFADIHKNYGCRTVR